MRAVTFSVFFCRTKSGGMHLLDTVIVQQKTDLQPQARQPDRFVATRASKLTRDALFFLILTL